MNKPKTMADKYLKDGVDVEEFIKEITYYIQNSTGYGLGYMKIVKGFLETSCKPTLTEDEKVILRNIDNYEKYIGRIELSNDSILYVSRKKDRGSWTPFPYADLFQFIQPRRRI